jgi:hypothetical protein
LCNNCYSDKKAINKTIKEIKGLMHEYENYNS